MLQQLKEKMVAGIELTSKEVQVLLEYDSPMDILEDVVEIYCGSGRWVSRHVTYYKFINDPIYYRIEYEKGLTECQENTYDKQVAKKFERHSRKVMEFYYEPVSRAEEAGK